MSLQSLIPWRTDFPALRDDTRMVSSLQRAMNSLFEEFDRDFGLLTREGRGDGWDFVPRVDVSETNESYRVMADLPGVREKDVNVTLKGDNLTITGERHEEKTEKGQSYYRHERMAGKFYRTIPLPSEVERDKIAATFKDGVLTVDLPKSKQAQASERKINITH